MAAVGTIVRLRLVSTRRWTLDKLIREKSVVRIGKDGFQLVGSGGWINLIVDGL